MQLQGNLAPPALQNTISGREDSDGHLSPADATWQHPRVSGQGDHRAPGREPMTRMTTVHVTEMPRAACLVAMGGAEKVKTLL